MLSFSTMKPSFSFTNEKIFTIPKTGFVNNFRLLKTIQAVLVRKERFDAASLLKTSFKGPFPTLMQRGRLFLFWNSAFVNGALWLVNTFPRLSCKKSKSAVVTLALCVSSSHGCTVRLLSLNTYSESLRYMHTKRSKLKFVREICWIIEDLVVSYISRVEITVSSYL